MNHADPFLVSTVRWTTWSPVRIEREIGFLKQLVFFEILGHSLSSGSLHVLGTLSFQQPETGRTYSLKVRLIYPPEYPLEVPSVIDEDKQFQPSANGHQFSDHMLCLSFPERREFDLGSEQLSSDVMKAALIWLDKRYIFERNGNWPGEAEEHGWVRPLRRLLKEEAARSHNGSISAWSEWVIAGLITPHYEKGCPCCSGRAFVACHRRLAMLSAQYLFCAQYEKGHDEYRSTLEAA